MDRQVGVLAEGLRHYLNNVSLLVVLHASEETLRVHSETYHFINVEEGLC
jgi:hypothetical protein